MNEKDYEDWLRTQPSVVSQKPADDLHHITGRGFGGMAMKPCDLLRIPLTRAEHTELHSMGWKTFEIKHSIDQCFEVCRLIQKYHDEHRPPSDLTEDDAGALYGL